MSKKGPGKEYKSFEVITQEDENGDVIIPIPPMMLKQLGWKEGDEMDFSFDEKGHLVITKKSK